MALDDERPFILPACRIRCCGAAIVQARETPRSHVFVDVVAAVLIVNSERDYSVKKTP